jgi:hypothetical protein
LKTFILVSVVNIFLICPFCYSAEEKYPIDSTSSVTRAVKKNKYRGHDGLHLEAGVGPVFGRITESYPGNSEIDFTGTGYAFEFKAGCAVKTNLIFACEVFYKKLKSPDITVDDLTYTALPDAEIDEVSFGIGLTFFSAQSDLFGNFTIGTGYFTAANELYSITTNMGLSGQFKGGKHFWFDDQTGFSLGAAIGFTSCKNGDAQNVENIRSERISLVASFVFN